MRQTALIVLLAQIGSFVPAKSARIGEFDAIFTRIGATDDLAGGRSTFMVEMSEVSYILTHATAMSLLILDEIGRGTSTFDGMAVAQAVLEYVAVKLSARTLFATHYHELTELENRIPNVVNYNITAKKKGNDVVFLRKVVRGGADDSFGVEVARLAGLPTPVINRAREILKALEDKTPRSKQQTAAAAFPGGGEPQMSISEISARSLAEELMELPLETLTPIEAMNALFALRGKARDICR
jgi:DNA mismatch repair protein MutS